MARDGDGERLGPYRLLERIGRGGMGPARASVRYRRLRHAMLRSRRGEGSRLRAWRTSIALTELLDPPTTEDPWVKGEAEDFLLPIYLRDVGRFSLLEPDEEERLILRLEDGRRATAALAEPGVSPREREALEERRSEGRQARDRIVLANLRLAVHVAGRYVWRGNGLELLDLIQEGNLGLLTAAERFEAGYGSFTTFAMPWIRQKLDRALAGQGRVLRIPMHVREKLERLRLEEEGFLAAKGRPPTPEELAAELGIDLAGLAELRSAEREVISLDQTVPGDEEESSFYEEVVEDPDGMAFAQGAEDRQWLAWILDGLDDRSRRILEQRFGLGLTHGQIGDREGLTGERVRQIARDALEKLRRRRSLP